MKNKTIWLMLYFMITFVCILLALSKEYLMYVFLLFSIQLLFFFVFIVYQFKRKHFQDQVRLRFEKSSQPLYNEFSIPKPFDENSQFFYDKVTEINTYYRRVLQQLERENKDFQEFITLWIHEVKTPLSTLYLQDIPQITHELDKIEHYLNFALYYAKSNTISKDYLIQPLSLKKLIVETLKKHKNLFILKNIQPILPQEDFMVHSDHKWLGFALFQMIDNALKYSKPNTKIIFNITKKKMRTTLSIQDQGIGIPKHDLPRIFEKGFTGSNRFEEKSTGLGLFLVKKICDQLHHPIEVLSDTGTTVYIHFPIENRFET